MKMSTGLPYQRAQYLRLVSLLLAIFLCCGILFVNSVIAYAATYSITTSNGTYMGVNNGRNLVRSSTGELFAAYSRFTGGVYQIYVANSTDDGQTWTETQLTSGTNNQLEVCIAADGDDHIHIVWSGLYDFSTKAQIRYCEYNAGWGAVANVTNTAYIKNTPSIAIGSNDTLHVVWGGKSATSSTCTQVQYIANNGAWGPVTEITSGNYNQRNPSIAIDSLDNIHVVWTGGNAATPSYSQLRYAKYDGSWSAVTDITSGNYHQNYPCVAIDSLDNIHVVWVGTDASSPIYFKIRYCEYNAGWGSITDFSTGNYNQYGPSISIDRDDNLYAMWYGTSAGSATYNQVRYSTYTGSWSAITDLTSGNTNKSYPSLLWANYPEWDTTDTGCAAAWTDDGYGKYYASADLAWNTVPSVVTLAASQITGSSARLNANIISDGGADIQIRFGYGNTSEANIHDYQYHTEWISGYGTGDNVYTNVGGLSSLTKYYFNSQVLNVVGNTTGTEKSFTTLEHTISFPSNLKVFPSGTSIDLSWTKGNNSVGTLIRYSNTVYPANVTQGNLGYLGNGTSTTISGLTSGTTYYLAAWGTGSGSYSANSTTLLITTDATIPGAGNITKAKTPHGWYQSPDATALQHFEPLYSAVNGVVDKFQMPRATGWLIVALVFCAVMALIIMWGTRSAIGGGIALVACMLFVGAIGLIPTWMAYASLLALVGAIGLVGRQAA